MAVISTILGTIGAAIGAITSAVSAATSVIGSFLAMPLGAAFGAGAGTAAAYSGIGAITIGGALAGVGLVTTAGLGLGMMYQSSRASAKAMDAQMRAMQELTTAETGTLEVNKTAKGLQDNSRVKRTLSSLRVPMGITPQQNTEITQNVYGVDMNPITAATQNMTGLNIAAA